MIHPQHAECALIAASLAPNHAGWRGQPVDGTLRRSRSYVGPSTSDYYVHCTQVGTKVLQPCVFGVGLAWNSLHCGRLYALFRFLHWPWER